MREHRIITFGLTDEQNTVVYESRPQSSYEIFETDEPTDVIAIGSVATIINANEMDAEFCESVFEFYADVGGCTDETIIWLGEPQPPKNIRKFFRCYNSFDDIGDKLRYILLSAHSKSKKAYEYSAKLAHGIRILSLVRKYPGISTQELSEKAEISVRSVQRYIAALQAAGEWIEYDRTMKGWKLFDGISILFGDDEAEKK